MENWQNNYFITHEYKNILDDENVIILDQGMIKTKDSLKDEE